MTRRARSSPPEPAVAFPTVALETFTAEEQRALAPYFTNTDRPVFALVNLPETVKGALFARYSRSAKSVRRLFLDEFLGHLGDPAVNRNAAGVGSERADTLYARVLSDYGDDSVAQLGGAHLACEGVSNILTKVLEWGRLMAYLEQSTRYVPYTDKPGGAWKYHVPAELDGSPLRDRFIRTLDAAFDTYARWIPAMEAHFRAKYPKSPDDSDGVYKSVIRAKALDTLRGLLPAATTSNVGLFGTGQAFEALLLRMFAHPLEEVRACAQQMLTELRQVIPAFLARVDQPNRGGRWIEYFAETRRAFEEVARPLVADVARRAARRSDAHRIRPGRRGEGGRLGAVCRLGAPRRSAARRSRAGCLPTRAPRCCARTPATARTAATSPAARSSAPAIASTSSPTTAPSATCSATACSRSSGSRSARGMAIPNPPPSRRPARSPNGAP